MQNKNQKTTKTVKTMLFASLTIAMILPFSGMQTVEAKEDVNDNGKLSAYEEWVLENLSEYSDMEKTQNILKLRSFVDTLDGYEAFIFDKIINIAEAEKQVKLAKEQHKSEKEIQKFEMQRITLYFELEEYGVTTKDRFDANPEYWKTRAFDAKLEMETPSSTNSVVMNNDEQTLHYIHQTDLALKRISILTVPLFGYGHATIPFPVITYGWNQGTSTSSWGFITSPTGGSITFESIVCLDSATHHDNVDFEMNSNGNTRNIFGQLGYNFDQTLDVVHSDSGDCETYTQSTVIPSSHSATLSTTIDEISLE